MAHIIFYTLYIYNVEFIFFVSTLVSPKLIGSRAAASPPLSKVGGSRWPGLLRSHLVDQRHSTYVRAGVACGPADHPFETVC